MEVVIDTGSTVNLLSYDALEASTLSSQFKYSPESEMSKNVMLTSFDGVTTVVQAGHVTLPVRIGNSSSVNILYLVARTTSHAELIGTSAITDFNHSESARILRASRS